MLKSKSGRRAQAGKTTGNALRYRAKNKRLNDLEELEKRNNNYGRGDLVAGKEGRQLMDKLYLCSRVRVSRIAIAIFRIRVGMDNSDPIDNMCMYEEGYGSGIINEKHRQGDF